MGQQQPVQVFVLVTEGTIEENLLATIAAKKDLALAALDSESDVEQVDLVSGMQELKNRLEILLGARPEAPATRPSSSRRRPMPTIPAKHTAIAWRPPAANYWERRSSSWESSSRSSQPRPRRMSWWPTCTPGCGLASRRMPRADHV